MSLSLVGAVCAALGHASATRPCRPPAPCAFHLHLRSLILNLDLGGNSRDGRLADETQATDMGPPHRQPHSSSTEEPKELLAAIRKQLPRQLPQLDAPTLAKIRVSALYGASSRAASFSARRVNRASGKPNATACSCHHPCHCRLSAAATVRSLLACLCWRRCPLPACLPAYPGVSLAVGCPAAPRTLSRTMSLSSIASLIHAWSTRCRCPAAGAACRSKH